MADSDNMKNYGVPFEPRFKFGDLKGKLYSDLTTEMFYSVYQQTKWVHLHFDKEMRRRRMKQPVTNDDPIITFGMYKGQCLSELPKDYLLYNLRIANHDLPVMEKYIETRGRRGNVYPSNRGLAHS